MSDETLDVEPALHKKYPDSVQPGIPKLGNLKDGWVRVEIGELFDEVSRPIKMGDDEEYALVTVRRSRGGADLRGIKKGNEISVKSQYIVREGDFLISKRQIVHGACALVPKELDGAIVSNEYSVLNSKDNLDSTFLSYLSHSQYFQQTCFHSSIGVHIEKMIFKLPEWFRWKIDIPQLEEQQKIASFLTAVDEKISKLQRKHELLQTYKRGVMQKLFSQEIRFKQDDGSSFPDWERIAFDKLARRVSEKLDPTTSDKKPNLIELENLESSTGQIISVSSLDSQTSIKTKFKKHDVLFGKLRPYLKKFAYAPFDGVCSSEIWVLRGIKVSNEYLYYLIQTDGFMRSATQSTGSKMPRADWKIISTTLFEIPTPDEQQKIATFLSTIDNKLDAVNQQISLTEQFKKGLLQQMFV